MATPKLLTSDEEESTEEEEAAEDEAAEEEEEEETVETDGGETVETDDEDDEPAVAVVDLPGDEEDDDEPSVAEGTTMGISNRALLFAGAGLLAIVAIIKFARSRRNSGQTSSPDRARAEAAKQVQQKQAEREQAQNGPQIQKDDSDPLAADGEAMDYVFGTGGAEHDGAAE